MSDQSSYEDQVLIDNEMIKIVEKELLKKLPHKHIGLLIWRREDNKKLKGTGSGFLISKNLVLTCAHNLYNR